MYIIVSKINLACKKKTYRARDASATRLEPFCVAVPSSSRRRPVVMVAVSRRDVVAVIPKLETRFDASRASFVGGSEGGRSWCRLSYA